MDLEGQGNSEQICQSNTRSQLVARAISMMLWGSLSKALVLTLAAHCAQEQLSVRPGDLAKEENDLSKSFQAS